MPRALRHRVEATHRLHPSVVVRDQDGARFALHLEKGEVLDVNASAALLLDRLRDGATTSDLVAALRDSYPDVEEEEARRDVEDLLASLTFSQFISG